MAAEDKNGFACLLERGWMGQSRVMALLSVESQIRGPGLLLPTGCPLRPATDIQKNEMVLAVDGIRTFMKQERPPSWREVSKEQYLP
jgi:hypothetical protein